MNNRLKRIHFLVRLVEENVFKVSSLVLRFDNFCMNTPQTTPQVGGGSIVAMFVTTFHIFSVVGRMF